jgi:hypothetical protein
MAVAGSLAHLDICDLSADTVMVGLYAFPRDCALSPSLLAVAVLTSWASSFFGFVQNLWGKGRQQPNAVDDPGKLESYGENLQDTNVQCAMSDRPKKKPPEVVKDSLAVLCKRSPALVCGCLFLFFFCFSFYHRGLITESPQLQFRPASVRYTTVFYLGRLSFLGVRSPCLFRNLKGGSQVNY